MYKQLTENDFIDFMNDLEYKSKEDSMKSYIMVTGTLGMFHFNLAMRGIGLPKGISYTIYNPKKLHNILYLNIGSKYSNYKMKIDMKEKKYSAYSGTILLGIRNSVEEATKLFKFKI